MSLQVMSHVLHHSEARLGDRLVLLVLADKCNNDGTGAWPSIATIGHEARLSDRAVQYSLRRLEAAGEIVAGPVSPYGTRAYDVVVGGANIAPPHAKSGRGGAQNPAETMQDFAPKPTTERSVEQTETVVSVSTIAREDVCRLCDLLAEGVRRNDPKANVNPRRKAWLTAARLLLDVDDRDPREVEEVIRWCQQDEFWRTTVLSMPTLRRQYAKLRLQMGRPAKPAARRHVAPSNSPTVAWVREHVPELPEGPAASVLSAAWNAGERPTPEQVRAAVAS